jgi:pimeloyl-ACP methyl ester carboxylesterase
MPIASTAEGYVPFRGYRTWYQVVGEIPAAGPRLPLLVLHGGPGFPHDYLTDLLVEPLVAGIRGAEHVVFQESSHLAMAEEPVRYRQVVGSFLDQVEAGQHR